MANFIERDWIGMKALILPCGELRPETTMGAGCAVKSSFPVEVHHCRCIRQDYKTP